MSNVTMRTSVQQEMSELENYIKQQSTQFRTKDLSVNEMSAEETIELKKGKDSLQASEPVTAQASVQVDISDGGRLKADNMQNSYLAYVNANASMAQTSHYQEYEDTLNEASQGFKEAFSTQKIGKYVDSGIEEKQIDYDYIDRLNSLYDELRSKIKTDFNGEEQKYRLSSLDQSYRKVFENNILNPIKSQYDSQGSFYQHGAAHTEDKQLKQSYQGILEGGKKLMSVLNDFDKWHDSVVMRESLKEVVDILAESAKSR